MKVGCKSRKERKTCQYSLVGLILTLRFDSNNAVAEKLPS